MSRSFHQWPNTRAALLIVAALAGSDCADSSGDERGTPLPEPPDGLPRPEWKVPEIVSATALDSSTLVMIGGERGKVAPNTQVWAINLDNPSVAPVRMMSDVRGRFTIGIAARLMDRVRVISRTETEHSPPLDLRVIEAPGNPANPSAPRALDVETLPSTALGCLQLTPAETVVLAETSGSLTLDNRCKSAVQITRAELRLGDQGLSLGTAPATIAPGAQTTLTFADSVGPGASERLDILLLDVDAGGEGKGRYAIDLFSALE